MNLEALINLSPSTITPKFEVLLHLEVNKLAIGMERGRIPNHDKIMKLCLVEYILSKGQCIQEMLRQRLESYFKATCDFEEASVIRPTSSLIPDIKDKAIGALDFNTITTLDGNKITLL